MEMYQSKIIFDIEPTSASRPVVTRNGTFYKKAYREFRKEIDLLMFNVPKTEYPCMLKGLVIFYIKMPASWSQKKKDALNGTYCPTTYDLDNLEKAAYDAMNDHVYKDDKQIVHHETLKVWSKNPRIEVYFELLPDGAKPTILAA